MSALKGQVAVVTGASSGIGAATARLLAQRGASIMLGARRESKLADVRKAIRGAGGTAEFVVTDMQQPDQVERLVDTAVVRFGRLDAIVNNAAMGTVRTIADGRVDEWRATFETNVIGTLVACRAALRHMLPHSSGTIVNVTSASAYEAWPYLSVYAASKAAVHRLSEGLRAEVGGRGVRVMTIEVHNVAGTDFASTFDPAVLSEAVQRWVDLGLLSRESPMIAADDVARAIAFQLEQPDPVSVHHVSVRSRAN
jgi:NADP-dependent 3-hydroxy acid dehydrogenase YdfG